MFLVKGQKRYTMEKIDIKKCIKNLDAVTGCTIGCSYCYARINNQRFPVTADFSVPELVERRLKRISTKTPNVYLMTSASDFSGWKDEWRNRVFDCMKKNPQHIYLFLTKRPELITYSIDMENVWFGVTINNNAEKERIKCMRKNIKSAHYFCSFEPLHDDLSDLDLDGIQWVVIGTETGKRKGKIDAKKEWVLDLTKRASNKKIPIFMKATLADVVGDEHFIQEFPAEFHQVFDLKKGINL